MKTHEMKIQQGHRGLVLIHNQDKFMEIVNSKKIIAEIKDNEYLSFQVGNANFPYKSFIGNLDKWSEDDLTSEFIWILRDILEGYFFLTCNCSCVEEFAEEFGFDYEQDEERINEIYQDSIRKTEQLQECFTEEELEILINCYSEQAED